MGVIFTLHPLYHRGSVPVAHSIEYWLGLRAGLDGEQKRKKEPPVLSIFQAVAHPCGAGETGWKWKSARILTFAVGEG